MTAISVGRECGMIRRNEKVIMLREDNLNQNIGPPTIICEVIDSLSQTSLQTSICSDVSFMQLCYPQTAL